MANETVPVLGSPPQLLLHAALVLVPLAVAGLTLTALWPAARRRFGWATVAFALATASLVPLVLATRDALKDQVGPSTLVDGYQSVGDQLAAWTTTLAVVGLVLMIVHARHERRRAVPPGRLGTLLTLALTAALLAAGLGSTLQAFRVGHLGDAGGATVQARTAPPAAQDEPR